MKTEDEIEDEIEKWSSYRTKEQTQSEEDEIDFRINMLKWILE